MASLPHPALTSLPTRCLTLGIGLGLTVAYLIRTTSHSLTNQTTRKWISAPSPPSPSSSSSHPYPPSALPGSRLVPTPYGTIQVYEFGPATGEKVLFLPGIGTPVVALGDLALRLAELGHRVMLFDLFGRGYSDAPVGVAYDERLYASQVLMVLASSPLCWTGSDAFHLVGYSLGGGVAVAFARYFGGMVRSLVCVAGGGLIRKKTHVGWRSRVLYSVGWVPQWVLERMVERRIRPARRGGGEDGEGEVDTEGRGEDSDANGGKGWDSTLLSRRRGGGHTVADVMEWQIREHRGFVKAFMSSIRYAPIYDRREDWAALGELLAERRRDPEVAGLRAGKVLLVLGRTDSVVVMEEVVEDATALLGADGVDVVEIDAGHELAFTHADEVAGAAVRFWRRESVLDAPGWVVS
ncbi:alpha/beta-hydrolase [Coniochaeta ligniaria NRRL 30616]|uniref:Alpha/beta-hydrolase n=1 Tax=Coniochaeta ligniaria NRRL 30616 TaxID=1408157 RepID=A0A1J7IVQ1_9PEZI|nr:alpha/beta-hydrolase [Coniochaeta ligniaria NRRL 30616]